MSYENNLENNILEVIMIYKYRNLIIVILKCFNINSFVIKEFHYFKTHHLFRNHLFSSLIVL